MGDFELCVCPLPILILIHFLLREGDDVFHKLGEDDSCGVRQFCWGIFE
jgi:hypothetical protein